MGGLGTIPGANIGEGIAIFEAVHGSAPDVAGKDIANPTALILSACLMLEHIGQEEPAQKIRQAVDTVLSTPENFTRDLGGEQSLSVYTEKLIAAM